MKPAKYILPVIVIAQFFCTSLWFAGNGVIQDLVVNFGLNVNDLGSITSAVQLGFITGTLIFAILSIADRYASSKVFMFCALLGALCNLGIIIDGNTLTSILIMRFLAGFFLAGIYPVGMKIAADYYKSGLGKSLGYLVGALVIGTAFPHILKAFSASVNWESIIVTTSVMATLGGLLLLVFVPDGPYRKASQQIDISAFFKVFKAPKFRAAAFGYFGHMWELYAFWTFVPIMLQVYNDIHPAVSFNIPLLSFVIIAVGGLSCVLGGYLSQRFGVKPMARLFLALSCLCCIVSPLVFAVTSSALFIAFLLFWGMVVIADSPLFSTLVAKNAPEVLKGTALTIVNCIGFTITIVSIQLLTVMSTTMQAQNVYLLLAIGPVLGLLGLFKNN